MLMAVWGCQTRNVEQPSPTIVIAPTGLRAAVDSAMIRMDSLGHGESVVIRKGGTITVGSWDSLIGRLRRFQGMDFEPNQELRFHKSGHGIFHEEEFWTNANPRTLADLQSIVKRKLDIHIPLEDGLNPHIILTEYEVKKGYPSQTQRLLLVREPWEFERLDLGQEPMSIRKESRLAGLDDAIAILDAFRE